jgi:glycine betaine catabolism A
MSTTTTTSTALPRTLPGRYYVDDGIFDDEVERIFWRHWFCVGRAEEASAVGDCLVRTVAGDELLVIRGDDDRLHAYFNNCLHRGTRLVEADRKVGRVVTCPYHAWSYALDGRLVGTPNIRAGEGLDRDAASLVEVGCDTWEGFVFVNLRADPPSLRSALADDPEDPMQFARFGMGDLRIGHGTDYPSVPANWKIMIQNYNECLHCPTVHPELVRLVPVYRRGEVVDDPDSWGVPLVEGATSMTRSGTSSLPALPGIDADDRCRYYGCFVFPNLFLDLMSDCVTYDILWPETAGRTSITGGYLFDPGTIAEPGFDPSELVEFSSLVMGQDIDVCERAQRGVGSRAFAQGGVYPFQDRYVHEFDQRYLTAMQEA